jgi:phage terminase large subunit
VAPFPGNKPPRTGIVIRSIDFGYNNPFVCLWIFRSEDDVWTVYDEHYAARRLLDYHAAEIQRRPMPEQGILRTWADPEDAQSRGELAERGIGTAAAKKDVNSGIEEVQKLLMVGGNGQTRLRVTSNCKNTIREMASYRWENNATENRDAKDAPRKKDDHTCDTLRYAVFSEKSSSWISPDEIKNPASLSAGFSAMNRDEEE